jgi:DNA repair exonuclease SbcCD ATPase subunit
LFKLRYIEIGPFRSFEKPQRIDFPENGMLLIEGENLDTGGSSGSGKSNLLIAIEYVFGSCPLPSTVLATWTSPDEPPTVRLGGAIDNKLIELKRTKKLEISEDGVEFKGSAAQKDEYLQKIIGLSPEVRQALTYRGQRSDGLFLGKTNSEKTEFLVPLLDLIRFEKANEVGETNAKKLNEKLNTVKSTYSALEGAVTAPDLDKINELEQQIVEYNRKIDLLKEGLATVKEQQQSDKQANIDEAVSAKINYLNTSNFNELELELKELQNNTPVFNLDNRELVKASDNLAECQKRLDNLIKEDNIRLRGWEDGKNKLNSQIQDASSKMGTTILESNKNKILIEVNTLKANKCPTCDREWLQALDKISELEKNLHYINNKIQECLLEQGRCFQLKSELAVYPKWEPDPKIDKLRTIKQTLSDQVAGERQKLNSAKYLFEAKHAKQIAEVKNQIHNINITAEKISKDIIEKHKPVIETFNVTIRDLESQIFNIQNSINAIKVDLATLYSNKNQYDNLQKQLSQKLSEKEITEVELNKENDLLNLLGREGFLGNIFDEVLEQISSEANDTLSGIANTRHVSLEFKSESMTQKGTVRKSIIPVVTVGGFTAPIKSALSGGMLSTVELAVDLAVMNVISRRSGVVPGYLMLDESFTGLDNVSKESCFQLLQNYAKDRLILIIDHSSEFKSQFAQVITISYENGCSTVKGVV